MIGFAVAALKAEGVRVVMLTGDNWTTAKAVARRLGIDEVEAEVLPEQKSEVVRNHKAAGKVVAMAGDGVNDARTSVLRWERAPTWRWRARVSRFSKAT